MNPLIDQKEPSAVVYKTELITVIWHNIKNGFCIIRDKGEDELIKMAESIEKIKDSKKCNRSPSSFVIKNEGR